MEWRKKRDRREEKYIAVRYEDDAVPEEDAVLSEPGKKSLPEGTFCILQNHVTSSCSVDKTQYVYNIIALHLIYQAMETQFLLYPNWSLFIQVIVRMLMSSYVVYIVWFQSILSKNTLIFLIKITTQGKLSTWKYDAIKAW